MFTVKTEEDKAQYAEYMKEIERLNARSTFIKTKLSILEKQFIEKKAAEKKYKNVSEYVRDKLICPEVIYRKVEQKSIAEFLYAINRTGNNQNQAMRLAHTSGSLTPEFLEQYKRGWDLLEEAIEVAKQMIKEGGEE